MGDERSRSFIGVGSDWRFEHRVDYDLHGYRLSVGDARYRSSLAGIPSNNRQRFRQDISHSLVRNNLDEEIVVPTCVAFDVGHYSYDHRSSRFDNRKIA
jgi:hypothetical protein